MEQKTEYARIELHKIRPSQTNSRKSFDEGKLKELAESIKLKGVIQPIAVRNIPGKASIYEIICGERRYKASLLAKTKDIPAVIHHEINEQQVLEFQIIENLQREDVHPLEEAEGYKVLLKEHGYKTVDDIAVKIGKSRTHVYDRLKLCDLIEENRRLFCDNKLSPSVALLVARIPAHLQKEAGRKISGIEPGANNGEPMSYRKALEYITNEFMLRLKEAGFDTDDAMLIETAGSCTMCAKRTGNQKELFPDVTSADVCTDPVCFKAKKAAGIQRALAKAKESGKLILSDRDAKKVFFSADSLSLGEGYISLDATCQEDKAGRKYKQLVKLVKDAKVTVGVNPHSGELAAMITRQEAARIRKQLGIVAPKPDKEKNKPAKTQKAEDRAKEERHQQIQEKITAKIVESIIGKVRTDTKMDFMRPMAEAMLEAYATPYTAFMFMKRRNPVAKREDALKLLKEHLSVIDDAELPGFCLELIIHEGMEFGEVNELTKKLCKLYEIDIVAIKNKTAAEENKIKSDAPIKSSEPAPAKEDKSKAKEAPAPAKRSEIKATKDGNGVEFISAKGSKITITAKGKTAAESKEAGEAVAQVAELFDTDQKKEKPAKKSSKKGAK